MGRKRETATKSTEATAGTKTTDKNGVSVVRLLCTRKCQVEGFGVVGVGEMIELPEERVDARIMLCFDADKPAEKEEVAEKKHVRKPGGEELTVDQLRSKLEDLRIYFPRDASKEQLEEMLRGVTTGTADFLGK